MEPNVVIERSPATERFPGGIGYRAVCCPDPSLLPHRHHQTALDDWAEHQFTHHNACHPRYCSAYFRHGRQESGAPVPCPAQDGLPVCGRDLDMHGTHWRIDRGTCNRPCHSSDEPCSEDATFDVTQWQKQEEETAEELRVLIAQLK